MQNPLKKLTTPAPRTPEREALAAAIDHFNAATAQAANVSGALETARSKVWGAEPEVDQARQAIEEAKHANAAHLTSVVMGTAGAAPLSVSAARQALQDAEDTLASAIASRDGLIEYQANADRTAQHAKWLLERAVVAVVAAEATQPLFNIIREHRAIRLRLSKSHKEIEFLLDKIGLRTNDLPRDLSGWNCINWFDEPEAPSAWSIWVKALETDADAALPEAM